VIAAGWGYLSSAWIGMALAATGLLLAALSFRLDARRKPAARIPGSRHAEPGPQTMAATLPSSK
jgi:hypothetical protein